ncbi:MAG: DUF58 domain-containing protein [Treponema sp.]|nr:DUF58 domain-containing protein [Treponema sp.]
MKNPVWESVRIRRTNLLKSGTVILFLVWIFTPYIILQFVCLFFIMVLVLSRLYTEYLINKIRVIRMDSELRSFRHEWVHVELKIENHGIFPAHMIVVNDSPGDIAVFSMKKIFRTMEKKSWTVLSWDGLCADRGVFHTGPAVVRGADPLGIFPFHLTAREKTKLYVYPVFRSISVKNNGGIPLGNMISVNPLFEDITRCRSLRPYTPGDEPRRINWKVSAHLSGGSRNNSGSLLVNEFEATASYPVMVFLNADPAEYHIKTRGVYIERTIEAAAALCLKTSSDRQELGIIFHTSCKESGTNVIQPSSFTLVPILERLAALDWSKYIIGTDMPAEGDVSHNSALIMLDHGKRLPYGTRYIYAGPDLGDEAYIMLNSLRRHHLYLEYIIIDRRKMPSLVPGKSKRHQMKETGYEII